MKKLLLGFISLILVGQVGFSQPVSDQAVIPMAITVNSILRLNIVSGGNIEFVFNSINDVSSGIANATAYDTRFTVASTTNWTLNFGTDLGAFTATGGGTIPLDMVALILADDAGGNCFTGGRCDNTVAYSPGGGIGVLVNSGTLISNGTGNVGNSTVNAFVINWECNTANATSRFTAAGGTVNAAPGRYSANVFLSLVAL